MAIYFDPNCGKIVEKLPGGKKRYLTPWKALEIAGQLIYHAQQYANTLTQSIANLEVVPELVEREAMPASMAGLTRAKQSLKPTLKKRATVFQP